MSTTSRLHFSAIVLRALDLAERDKNGQKSWYERNGQDVRRWDATVTSARRSLHRWIRVRAWFRRRYPGRPLPVLE